MSEDMPRSWRYLTSASSRLYSSKALQNGSRGPVPGGHPHHKLDSTSGPSDEPQSWRAWAGRKIKMGRGQSDRSVHPDTETISLFPGWAARRYRKPGSNELEEAFEVDVFVSGFASSHGTPETASRSQRAFIRLAKGFASLPKLTADAISPEPESLPRLSPSTEALLAQIKLPPRPTEITEQYEIEMLERQLKRANSSKSLEPVTPGSSRSSSIDQERERTHSNINPPSSPPPSSSPENKYSAAALPADALRRLHANLESRLRPFWSSVLPSRTVTLHLYASPHQLPNTTSNNRKVRSKGDQDAVDYGPVASQNVLTAADGSFQARFKVKWEDLCQHPGALHIAFGDRCEEHDLLVAAQLMPAPTTPSSSAPSNTESNRYPGTVYEHGAYVPSGTLRISITHSPIRVISDIDDTVKLSNILSGARAVFHNVFVKDLEENIIPGMGEWYTNMWSRGVRFHYVSNSPFELLPVLSEFFQVSQLPPGSIKLRSYAGRSLFNGLLSAPATRKRAGVVDILDSFPDSQFFLIGDTGEQDLELYADLAREHPSQILAVLVRDVDAGDPIDDPTGWKAIGAAGTRSRPLVPGPNADDTPRPRRTFSDMLSSRSSSPSSKAPKSLPLNTPGSGTGGGDYFTPSPLSAEPEAMPTPADGKNKYAPSSLGGVAERATSLAPLESYLAAPSPAASFTSRSSSSSMTTNSSVGRMSEAEKKRYALQLRVYRARTQMPGHVPLRVFRDPDECVEVSEILEKAPKNE